MKKLSKTDEVSEGQFKDELKCLIRVKHKNIVRLLGYCWETQEKVVKFNGMYVLADVRRRFLCFEYVPNGSLHDYIKGLNAATTIRVGFSSMYIASNCYTCQVSFLVVRKEVNNLPRHLIL